MRSASGALILLAIGIIVAASAQGQDSARGPLDPEAALASFELEPGYGIELVASEPLVQDPVAIAFDERGRLYVVENRGYPDPLDGRSSSLEGVIGLLTDRNADGRYDERTEFATGLAYPNGVLPWNGGVFVTDAPDLIYLKDTNHDGVADERRVVLTGFQTTRTTQLRFSHPTLGLDNWIYLTSGLNGGRVSAPGRPDRPAVTFTSSDSRFNPVTLDFELTGGQGQFGLTFDDYGRRFVCSNRNPAWHVVLETRHLARNPHLPFTPTVHEVAASGADARVWPISADMTTASFMPDLLSTPHAGTFTAASGLHIHRGDALPAGHEGSLFICESAQNLVQRQVRTMDGVTFRSSPAREGVEFLASRDSWFRPVFAANGPDGALYVVDMYRKNIDHPQYVPEPARGRLDFVAGKRRGRIYRIADLDWTPGRSQIDAARSGVEELSSLLEHRNSWWRETAQRLIVERRQRDAIPLLRRMAEQSGREVARIHALWTLDGLGALDEASLRRALRDRHAAVRENALRLAEPRLLTWRSVLDGLLELSADPEPRVRLHLALALGGTDNPRAVDALAALAARDGADPWMRAAILSSVGNRAQSFFRAFARVPRVPPATRTAVMRDVGHLFGAGLSAEACLELMVEITTPRDQLTWEPAALAGIAKGLETKGGASPDRSALMTLVASPSKAAAVRSGIHRFLERIAALAIDDRSTTEARLAAIELLGHTDFSAAGRTLEALLGSERPVEIQLAAIRALAHLPEGAAGRTVVDPRRWRAYTPRLRDSALSALVSQPRHIPLLLDAIEHGDIPLSAVGPFRRSRLVNHADAAVRERARRIFGAAKPGDRMQVYERYRPRVLGLPGNRENGAGVFDRACGPCHTVRSGGARLGPDLSGIHNQPADAILLHTLVPDHEIAPAYGGYVVETRDGRTLSGLLVAEGPDSITVRDAALESHVIPRALVSSMSTSPRSLMPNDFEQVLSEQDLADVIAYLTAGSAARER